MLLIYSITSRSSFENLSNFRKRFQKEKEREWLPIVLVGNKCDLEDDRQVTREEGEELAKEWDIPFFEVSAKDIMFL